MKCLLKRGLFEVEVREHEWKETIKERSVLLS